MYLNILISSLGKDATFISPFGRRKIVECDYTASGNKQKIYFKKYFFEGTAYVILLRITNQPLLVVKLTKSILMIFSYFC